VTTGTQSARGNEEKLRGLDTLVLENEYIRTRVLIDKGCDLYELIYKPKGVDVLWKSPWGLRDPSKGVPIGTDPTNATAWLEYYPGGWQVLLPNGGDACVQDGAPLPFHGETAIRPWELESLEHDGEGVVARLSVDCFLSPVRLTRTFRLGNNARRLQMTEQLENLSPDPVTVMWTHHPGFGPPLVDAQARLDTGARRFESDDRYDVPGNPLPVAQSWEWPMATDRGGQNFDLRRLPGPENQRAMLGYLHDFQDGGWFAITNPALGFGVGLTWPVDVFPHAWFWQEVHSSAGFPWYRRAYVAAVEPSTTTPGQGLTLAKEKGGTPLQLDAHQSVEAQLGAVFYEGYSSIERISADGTVEGVKT
jgi:Domain of unknown function (DUF4432)